MMSHSRFQQMLASVHANARKVYDAVPMSDGWSYAEIGQEMQRLGLAGMRLDILQGCIRALRDAGLVYEVANGRFQRSPHKARPVLRAVPTTTQQPEPDVATTTPNEIKPTPVDRIGTVAANLRDLSKTLAAAADELDHLAIDIEERAESDAGAAKQLQQLRATFKSLGLG